MLDDLSLIIRQFFSLRGRTDRVVFNIVLMISTLPYLFIMIADMEGAALAVKSGNSDPMALLQRLQQPQGPHTVDWAALITIYGVAFLLFPMMVRRLRDCGMALWSVWIVYLSFAEGAFEALTGLDLPSPLPMLLGILTLIITFRMSMRPSKEGMLPDDHRSQLLPDFLEPKPAKRKVDPATFVPNDGDDEQRTKLDDPSAK